MPLVEPAGPGVVIEWNPAALRDFTHNPEGPFSPALHAMGETVAEGAKARCLVATGRMRDEITYELETGPRGVEVSVVSPATDPATGTNYPRFHEGRKVRDRRPHRSLIPALADIYKIAPRIG